MADLVVYLTTKYIKMITEISADLGRVSDELAQAQNIIRALKSPDTLVAGAPLTLDRLQVMETGDIRVIPPIPTLDTCTQSTNGKKSAKELAGVS